ncbi:MAG: RT0821/Lpp0805 family surface protein [Rickettsiaceae bacterium]|nr:RT0821/Lpp0805 family surface protein [Rickettsiaceae bacterium]
MLKKNLATLMLCTLCLNSCAQNGGMSKQSGGAILGAVTGGLVGSLFGKGEGKVLAIGAGAILGGLAGGAIGASLDEKDRMMADYSAKQALERAPSGQSVAWNNPDSGHSGYITPTRTFQKPSGQYCREYSHSVNIGGKEESAYGTACRKPDGAWEIIN